MTPADPQPESLTELREVFAVAQKDLGEQGTISRIERGVHRAQPSTIRQIEARLGCGLMRVALACRESYRRGLANRSDPDATPISIQVIGPGHAPNDRTPPLGVPALPSDHLAAD